MTDLGCGRTNNEDFALVRPDLNLFAVADGMGGHAAGEVASAVASAALAQAVAAGESLERAVEQAHLEVLRAAASGRGGAGMGTTVVALRIHEAQFEIAWVGDSRAYLFHATSGTMELLTRDHSYVQGLLDAGLIDKEQMRRHPDRNVITQCLGSRAGQSMRVSRLQGCWETGDIMLLCSDGLSDNVDPEQFVEILRASDPLTTLAQRLIDTALAAKAQDNVTAILVSPIASDAAGAAGNTRPSSAPARDQRWLRRASRAAGKFLTTPRTGR